MSTGYFSGSLPTLRNFRVAQMPNKNRKLPPRKREQKKTEQVDKKGEVTRISSRELRQYTSDPQIIQRPPNNNIVLSLVVLGSWIDEVQESASWLCVFFLSRLLSLGSSDRRVTTHKAQEHQHQNPHLNFTYLARLSLGRCCAQHSVRGALKIQIGEGPGWLS